MKTGEKHQESGCIYLELLESPGILERWPVLEIPVGLGKFSGTYLKPAISWFSAPFLREIT